MRQVTVPLTILSFISYYISLDILLQGEGEEFLITGDMFIWKAMYLPDLLVKGVWELGFKNPTAIQVKDVS